MAKKVQIKVNIAALRKFFSYTIVNPKTGASKECFCIPKDALYAGKDGAFYLDLVGYEDERKNYGRLFSLKEHLNRADYDALKAANQQLPFCGDIKEQQDQQPAQAAAPAPTNPQFNNNEFSQSADAEDDLPF